MIIDIFPNTNPSEYVGNTVKVLGKPLPLITPNNIAEFCVCNYIRCNYREPVFASNSNDFWKNDKSDFLFRKVLSTDNVQMSLYKNGVLVSNLNDDTYGTYFGSFSGSDAQQLYIGYLIDWQKVFVLSGVGIYTIRAELNIVGVADTIDSREFDLSVYSPEAANGTVRIESYQNGSIFGSGFDYSGINWYSSLRVNGSFGNPTPEYTTDNYITSNNEKSQIKDTMSRKWTLTAKMIPWEVVEKLVYNQMLANQILVTDYNIFSESVWRRVDVKLSEISKSDIVINPQKIYNFTMLDTKNIYEKRNY